MSTLQDVTFCELDSRAIESAVITAYERIAGVTLYAGDPVRLFLESLAWTLTIQNNLIDMAGRQNLLAYAQGAHLDHLGALMGVTRIPAQNATCTMRFALAQELPFAVPVPAGTRVATRDGGIVFATVAAVEIPAGDLYVETLAQSTEAGAASTGLVAGQVNALVDPLPYIAEVTNTTLSVDGADIEDDERLRGRIRLAPESYTVAGSAGAYEARVLEVSVDIMAVSVHSPEPGVVDIRLVLTNGEMPDATTLQMVRDALSVETVRPLTDTVLVAAPDVVEYAITGQWYVKRADVALLGSIMAAVDTAVEEYRVWQRSRPGRDIVPSRLVSLVQQAGAKRVALTSPDFRALTPVQIAREAEISLTFGGVEDE